MGRQQARQGVGAIPSQTLAWARQILNFQDPDTVLRFKRSALPDKSKAAAVHELFDTVNSQTHLKIRQRKCGVRWNPRTLGHGAVRKRP